MTRPTNLDPLLFALHLKVPDLRDLLRSKVVLAYPGLAPLILAVRERDRLLAVQHWPGLGQLDLLVEHDARYHAVPAADSVDILVVALGDVGVLAYSLGHGGLRDDVARASVRELNVQVGGGPNVVGRGRLEFVHEGAEIVEVQGGIGLDENVPLGVLPIPPGLQEHGQELVLVEVPALAAGLERARVLEQRAVRLELVVQLKVVVALLHIVRDLVQRVDEVVLGDLHLDVGEDDVVVDAS